MSTTTSAADAIAVAKQRVSNWGRWGKDDVLGTLNFIDGDKRRSAAAVDPDGRIGLALISSTA